MPDEEYVAKPQKATGDDLVEMILGMVQDIDDEALLKAANAVLRVPVEATDDGEFIVHWDKEQEDGS